MGTHWVIRIGKEEQPACCPACAMVGQTITDAGLGDYYRRRTAPAPRPASAGEGLLPDELHAGSRHIRPGGNGRATASLIIHDIHCAACIWLIEERLSRLPGVTGVLLNYSTHRLTVDWDAMKTGLDEIVHELNRIGYRATPYDEEFAESAIRAARREQIKRIAIAGVLGMQVMMLATALYFGDAGGIDAGLRTLLTWTSLLLCIPIVMFSARPFFSGAVRDIRNRRLGMDVPVSLGISIAFAGSVSATVTGQGAVYFESVAMFVFLLLVARHFQQTALHRNAFRIEALGKTLTDTAVRVGADGERIEVTAGELVPGDIVLVSQGCTIPADGRVVSGTSSVDESLLSGEEDPIVKGIHDLVLAGSTNLEQPLKIRVTREPGQNTVAQIMRLVERAMATRPASAMLADRIAGKFILVVLIVALGAAIYWYRIDPDMWLPVTVSILVVTCPCALSLAAPAAFTAAIHALGQRGLATLRADALTGLGTVDHVIFDKTGTLTESRLQITRVEPGQGFREETVLHLAASLESYVHHPIARALRQAGAATAEVRSVRVSPGEGLQGDIDDTTWYLGNAEYVRRHAGAECPEEADSTCAILASRGRICGKVYFESKLRDNARDMVTALKAEGIDVSLYSGDNCSAVSAIAASTGITDWQAALSPQEKMELARKLQVQGKIVAMIGDGINDAPVLAVSNVSVAMAEGASLAHAQSDFVLLNNRLDVLVDARRVARKCAAVLQQNMAWAIFYNALAIPAAVFGMIPPWLAMIGMSASSLLVVANSVRIGSPGTVRAPQGL